MNPPRWTPIALAALCALTACTSGGEEPEPGGSFGSGAPETTASPSPTGLTPESYRSELESATEPVGSTFKGLTKAKSIKSLDQRLERAEGALSDAVDKLRSIAPPPDVAAEHGDYVEALRDLQTGVGDMRDRVAGQSLCSSSAVLASLGRTDAFAGLKDAANDLNARGDYPADVITVKAPKQQNRRLKNGAFIRNGGRGGRSKLAIKNGNTVDAVITLVRGKSKVMSVYVRKRKSFTVSSVRDGTYKVYYTTGKDWDRSARSFTRECGFKRFEKSIRFRTVFTATQIRWNNWRLTLNPVVGGNARTRNIKPGDFPR